MASGKAPRFVLLDEAAGDLGENVRELRGHRAFDRAGVEIGVVDGLVLDEAERRPRLLRIQARESLEPERPRFLVPVETIDRLESDRLFLDVMRERVLSGPIDDPATWDAPDHWDGLYNYHGVSPFWSTAAS